MKYLALAAALLVSASIPPQDPPKQSKEEIKKALMDKVKKRLEEERARILERVGKTIDEEMKKAGAPPSVAELIESTEKRVAEDIKKLEAQLAAAKSQLAEFKYWREDASLIEDAQKNGPKNARQVSEMFKAAYTMIDKENKYAEAADIFKKVYYMVQIAHIQGAENDAVISAYNAACAYSRLDKREKALDWLQISFNHGFFQIHGVQACQYDPSTPHNAAQHAEHDPDLENIRDEPRYKEILKPFSNE